MTERGGKQQRETNRAKLDCSLCLIVSPRPFEKVRPPLLLAIVGILDLDPMAAALQMSSVDAVRSQGDDALSNHVPHGRRSRFLPHFLNDTVGQSRLVSRPGDAILLKAEDKQPKTIT